MPFMGRRTAQNMNCVFAQKIFSLFPFKYSQNKNSLAPATTILQTQLMLSGDERRPPVPISLCFKSTIHSNLSHKWMHQGFKKFLTKSIAFQARKRILGKDPMKV